MKLSIRSKITAPYIILALFVAMGGAYIITQVILESIEERFNNQVIETGKLTVESFWREENLLLETLRTVTNTQGVAAAVRASDSVRLRELLLPIIVNSHDELIVTLDSSGVGILTISGAPNGNLEEFEFTQGDLQYRDLLSVVNVLNGVSDQSGNKYSDYFSNKNQSFFLIAAPISDESGEIVGAALVGKSTSSLVRQFREATFAQTTIYNMAGEITNSTLSSIPSISSHEVETIISQKDSQTSTRNILAENINYREVLYAWQTRDNREIGIIGSALPTAFLTSTNSITRFNVFVFTSFILVMVIVVGLYVANLITKPLVKLKNAAEVISEGDLSIQVIPSGGDEISSLTNSFNEMVTNLRASKNALVQAYDKSLEGWANALELRDEDTEGHSQRVAVMTVELAKQFGYQGAQLEHIRRGALLHDIGKMGIPDNILRKANKLNKKEWEIMKRHPELGRDLLKQIEYLHPAIDIPYSHHEKWDGSGYPQGLKGTEIPRPARIFAVADVWDAVRSDRSYRSAMTESEAVQVIRDGRGTHFDPEVVDVFLSQFNGKRNTLIGSDIVQAVPHTLE